MVVVPENPCLGQTGVLNFPATEGKRSQFLVDRPQCDQRIRLQGTSEPFKLATLTALWQCAPCGLMKFDQMMEQLINASLS